MISDIREEVRCGGMLGAVRNRCMADRPTSIGILGYSSTTSAVNSMALAGMRVTLSVDVRE